MQGKCYICNKTFSKAGMTKHLRGHLKDDGDTKLYHILVDAYGSYWLHIEIKANAKLKDLDQFLRDIWLECCWHLSEFEIEGENFEGKSSTALSRLLSPGMEFYHTYDFGSPTELRLKVVGERKGKAKDNVQILARNEIPAIKCECGKIAKWVCTECMWEGEGEGWLCDDCAEEHECGEDMLLPVVNSPRVGVCGYEGSDKYGD